MTTTISNLSQELRDRRIDYLHCDTKSLKSLSPVFDKWTPPNSLLPLCQNLNQDTTDISSTTPHTSIQQLDLIQATRWQAEQCCVVHLRRKVLDAQISERNGIMGNWSLCSMQSMLRKKQSIVGRHLG
ncbi:hypothetical protein MPER_11942 [Moniliophthora perniciosa FA553]|nr:hypothetical protein MPER_11942 [Moniliophthora perniciosa FA553]